MKDISTGGVPVCGTDPYREGSANGNTGTGEATLLTTLVCSEYHNPANYIFSSSLLLQEIDSLSNLMMRVVNDFYLMVIKKQVF